LSGIDILHGVRGAIGKVVELMGLKGAMEKLHVIPCTIPI
jgi:hypothetical protein